jgi:hypothetical protein
MGMLLSRSALLSLVLVRGETKQNSLECRLQLRLGLFHLLPGGLQRLLHLILDRLQVFLGRLSLLFSGHQICLRALKFKVSNQILGGKKTLIGVRIKSKFVFKCLVCSLCGILSRLFLPCFLDIAQYESATLNSNQLNLKLRLLEMHDTYSECLCIIMHRHLALFRRFEWHHLLNGEVVAVALLSVPGGYSRDHWWCCVLR